MWHGSKPTVSGGISLVKTFPTFLRLFLHLAPNTGHFNDLNFTCIWESLFWSFQSLILLCRSKKKNVSKFHWVYCFRLWFTRLFTYFPQKCGRWYNAHYWTASTEVYVIVTVVRSPLQVPVQFKVTTLHTPLNLPSISNHNGSPL